MKKNFAIVLLSLSLHSVIACDICGCGAANYYWGIMPQFHKNFIGTRYRTQSFDSHLGMHQSLATSEFFQTVEVWGRYYISPKWQAITFVPYHINKQVTTTETKYLQGMGDIPIIVNYNLFTTTDDALRKVQHNWWLGGGIKFPTGQYKFQAEATQVANPNFQLGTGSVDFLLNTWYIVRMGKAGLTADATLRLATANSDEYKFGNRINGSLTAFYVKQIKTVGVMPYAGLFYEYADLNKQSEVLIRETGGQSTFFSLGSEVYVKSLAIGFTYQTPVNQSLAEGRIMAHDRLVAYVTWMF